MATIPLLNIGKRIVGPGYPCFIVAELSGNHHQRYEEAVALIEAAVAAGADAVKLQTYTPDTITISSNREWFLVGGEENPENWKGKTLHELYQTAYTPWEWQPKLKKIAEDLGLIFFSTPFDETAVNFLENMSVPCHKIASYEITDIPLLKKVAATGKPVILSTGLAVFEDVDLAVRTLRENGASELAVLHCVTAYSDAPSAESMNLETIRDIAQRFGVVAGFSDNNAGIEFPVLAVAVGAAILEKHVILSRSSGGPDARFSIEPDELKVMVELIRRGETARGNVHYGPATKTEEYNSRLRRSLFLVADMKAGELFTPANIRSIRPAFGLHPKFFDEVLGKKARRDIERGTPLSWDLIA